MGCGDAGEAKCVKLPYTRTETRSSQACRGGRLGEEGWRRNRMGKGVARGVGVEKRCNQKMKKKILLKTNMHES